MISIENVLVSDEVVDKQFICDLDKCKGGCCEDGDAGAPLDKEELEIINCLYEQVEPYLSEASRSEINRQGKYVYHREFGWVTPTLPADSEICVYGIRGTDGVIKCAFEQAYYDQKTSWKKPLSCHLFPIIASPGKNGQPDKINYEPRPRLCSPACSLGKQLKVPVYQFLKEALIRKYGNTFYQLLDSVAKKKDKRRLNPAS